MAVDVTEVSTKVRNVAGKKWVLAVGGSVLIGAMAMMISNPGQSAYVDYATERLSKELKQDCDQLEDDVHVGGVVTLPTRDLCRSFIGSADFLGRGAVKLVIDGSTARKNFGIFSIYTTELPGRSFKTLGIGRQFLMFHHQ